MKNEGDPEPSLVGETENQDAVLSQKRRGVRPEVGQAEGAGKEAPGSARSSLWEAGTEGARLQGLGRRWPGRTPPSGTPVG